MWQTLPTATRRAVRFYCPHHRGSGVPTQRIIAAAETRLDEPIFDDAVTLCWRMPAGQEEALRTALNELTRGGAEVEISAPQYAAF